jgi:lipopolysaccharide export system protein LptC
MKITEGGDNIRFDGNVVMNLDNVPAESAPEQPATRSAKAGPANGKSSNAK